MSIPGLPPGAVLDAPPQAAAQIPGLPPGAVLDQPPVQDQWRTPGGLYHFMSPAGDETFSKSPPPPGSTPVVAPSAAMNAPSTLKVAPLGILGVDAGTFDTHIPISGSVNDKLTRLGRGAEDIFQGTHQLALNAADKATGGHSADAYTASINNELKDYEAGRAAEGNTGVDWMRGFGTAATPLSLIPGAGATLGRTALLGAAAGGAGGALRYDEQNTLGDRLKNAGVGAATGAVIAPAAQLASQGILRAGQSLLNSGRSAAGKLSDALGGTGPADLAQTAAGPAWNGLPEEAQAALTADARSQMSSGTVDPVMLERKANLLAQGVTPTKSMVTRQPADWSIERNLQKIPGVGDELTKVYQSNDQALAGQLQTMLKGLPEATQEAHAMAVLKGVDNLSRATQKEVGDAYKAVSASKGSDFGMEPKALNAVLDNLDGNAFTDQLRSTVLGKLKKLGEPTETIASPASRILDASGQPMIPAGEPQVLAQRLTVDQAGELRKFVNSQTPEFANGVSLGGFKKQIINAIDQDVLGTTGEDAFAGARAIASGRFKLLGNPAVQKALDNYGELTQGKTAQNFIQQNIVNAPIQDVKTLAASLDKIPDPQMKASAQQALEAGTLNYFQKEAINPKSLKFSGSDLTDALNKFGQGSDEKLATIIGQQKADALKKLAQAGVDATYEPAYSSVNHSNTAPTAVSFMNSMRKLPILGKPSEWVVTPKLEEGIAANAYRGQLGDALGASADIGPQNQLAQRQALARMLTKYLRPGTAAAVSLNQARDAASQ